MKKIYTMTLLVVMYSFNTYSQCNVFSNRNAPTCNGACDGSANATAIGGAAPYAYTWSTVPAQNTPKATGLCAGTYTISITDSKGCTSSRSVVIAQPAPLNVSAAHKNPACAGSGNGTATANPTGGTQPYSYSWNTVPSRITKTIGNLMAGVYIVLVKDSKGCTATISDTLVDPAALKISASATTTACGSTTGTASSTVTGGSSPYTYTWGTVPVQNLATATGLGAGIYTITARDSRGCSVSTSATVTSTGGLAANIFSSNNISCNGGNSGSATVTATGGTTPYTYSWSSKPSQTTGTASGLVAGTYSVVVSDGGGCSFMTSVKLTQIPAILSNVSRTNISCNGGSNGTATVSASGGTSPYGFSWSNNQTTATATGLGVGTYTVTITDSKGCTSTKTTAINQPLVFSVNTSHKNISCNGGTNGSVTANTVGGTGPFTYSWSVAQTGKTIFNLGVGTYTVVATDKNGCTATQKDSVAQPAVITATATSTNAACGSTNGSATVVAAGGTSGYTYLWSTSPPQTTAAISNITAGVYLVRIRDANGCTLTVGDTVKNTGGGTSTVAVTNIICRGTSTGAATVSTTGGTTPFTYSWNTTPPQTTASVSGLAAGNYIVAVKDAAGCTFSVFTQITQPATGMTLTTGNKTNVGCFGGSNGSVTATVSGGTSPYLYSWSSTPVQSTATATGLAAATYTILVTDNKGCTAAKASTITQPGAITASTSSINSTCNGGNNGIADVAVKGGAAPYTYSWNTTPTASTRTVSGLMAGYYTVHVSDKNGCTVSAIDSIKEPAAMVVTTTKTDAACGNNNGMAAAAVNGGSSPYTFSWNTNPVKTTSSVSGLAAGIYIVTVRDNKGCSQTASLTISNVGSGTASAVTNTNVTCHGGADGRASSTITGGASPFTYAWNSVPAQTAATATGLMAGTYTVTITDANNCQSPATVIVTEPPAITAITSSTNATCGSSNGSVSVKATGGTSTLTYAWSGGATASSVSGLAAGTYTITVKDGNNCSQTATAVISQTGAPVASATGTAPSCFGGNNGSADATVTGGSSPYTFSWSNTATGANVSGLAAGTFTVTVTDAGSCSATATVTLTPPAQLTAATTSTAASCNGTPDGSASATASGGTQPYIYSWSNNTSAASTSGITGGTYTVNVMDAQGCSATATVVVAQPTVIVVNVNVTNSSCGNATGTAVASVSGGSSPYSYSWSNNKTSSAINGLNGGIYSVVVKDANNCTNSGSGTVADVGAGTASIAGTKDVTCNGGLNGSISAAISGGASPYIYSWNTVPSQTTASATGLGAGTYSVTISDANNCSSVVSATISEPPAIILTTTATSVSCNGLSDGGGSVVASGGTPGYTYSWNNSETTVTVTGLAAATYTVNVTDANGCKATTTIVVTAPPVLSATGSSTGTICHGTTDGTVSAAVAGGTSPYTYSWSTSPSQTVMIATGLGAGTYTVTAMDANGCSTTATAVVAEPAMMVLNITPTSASCAGSNGTATVSVTGGGVTPFTYSWNNAATGAGISNIPAGSYTVEVTDANGCTQTATTNVNSIGGPAVSVNVKNASCNGDNNGSAAVTAIGGLTPYAYSWNTTPAQTTTSATGLTAGSYTVVVTDNGGCVSTGSGTITQPPALVLTKTHSAASCLTCADGSATVSVAGGTSPYVYNWSTTPAQTSATATGLLPGVYTYCATDANDCTTCDTLLVDASTGIAKIMFDNSLRIFPNPSNGQFNIELTSMQSMDVQLRIISILGQVVVAEEVQINGTYHKLIDMSGFDNGVYQLQIISKYGVASKKLILNN